MARELVFATYLAPSVRPLYGLVASAVGEALGVGARLVTGGSFDDVRSGAVDFAFICGLPYVRLRAEGPEVVRPLAAPVLTGERYGGRPVYFSDVVVAAGSDFRAFADLRGKSWAYNEPDSHSGYLVTLKRLEAMGEDAGFFGRVVMTGYHQESLRRVAEGEVDASAIDSQVLEVAMRADPGLGGRVRVIDSLGPSSVQPLVATRAPDAALAAAVRSAVSSLRRPAGNGRDWCGVERWVAVEDADYDDIRAMLRAVEEAGLSF